MFFRRTNFVSKAGSGLNAISRDFFCYPVFWSSGSSTLSIKKEPLLGVFDNPLEPLIKVVPCYGTARDDLPFVRLD